MKIIHLTQGKMALVDDADYDFLSQYKWCAHKHSHGYYAVRNLHVTKGKSKTILMHRVVLHSPSHLKIDHKDGNGLNNQKDNLRFASVTQNSANRRPSPNKGSKFKGVWQINVPRLVSERWCAEIQNVKLGCFKSQIEAAMAYDREAFKRYGEFALTNKMLGLY